MLGAIAALALTASPAAAAVFSYKVPNGLDEVVVTGDRAVWLVDGDGPVSDRGAWVERRGADGSVRRVDIGETLLGGLYPAPDGSVWAPRLTEGGILTYHRILPTGEMRFVSNEPDGMQTTRLAGVDGTGMAWLTGWDGFHNHVLRMTPEGAVEDRGFWESSAGVEGNWKWSLGPDGNLWEAGRDTGAMGQRAVVARLTTSGDDAGKVSMFFPDFGPDDNPMDLARQAPLPGPAGALWSLTSDFLLGITPVGEFSRVPLAAGVRAFLSQLATRPGAPLWAVHGAFAKVEDSSGESELRAIGTIGAGGGFRGLACLPKETIPVWSDVDQTGAALVLVVHTSKTDAAGDRLTWLYRVEPGTPAGTGCPVDPGPLAVTVKGPVAGPGRFASLKFRVHVNRRASVAFTRGRITIGSGRSAKRFGFTADQVSVGADQTKVVRGFGVTANGFGGDLVRKEIRKALGRGKRVRLCFVARAYHDASGTSAKRSWCGRIRG